MESERTAECQRLRAEVEAKAAQLQKVQGELDEMHKEHSVRVLVVTTPSGVSLTGQST